MLISDAFLLNKFHSPCSRHVSLRSRYREFRRAALPFTPIETEYHTPP